MKKEDFIMVASSTFLVGEDKQRAEALIIINQGNSETCKGVSPADLGVEVWEIVQDYDVVQVMQMILDLSVTLENVYRKGALKAINECQRLILEVKNSGV